MNLQVKKVEKSLVCTLLGGNTKEMKEATVKTLKGQLEQLKTKMKNQKNQAINEVSFSLRVL